MTNTEKFVEVFGTDLKRQYSTKTWWEQEFVPNKTSPTGDDSTCDECTTPCIMYEKRMRGCKPDRDEEV